MSIQLRYSKETLDGKLKEKRKRYGSTSLSAPSIVHTPSSLEASTRESNNKDSASINVPLEQQALFYYMQTYVQAPKLHSSKKRFSDFLRPFYAIPEEDSKIRLVISAISDLLFGFVYGRKSQTLQAQAKFTTVLALTRRALDDPDESRSDETMIAVLLSTMYEVRYHTRETCTT